MVPADRIVFEVLTERVGDQWGVTAPDVPGAVSLVPDLDMAEGHIREAIAFVARLDPGAFDVHLPSPPG